MIIVCGIIFSLSCHYSLVVTYMSDAGMLDQNSLLYTDVPMQMYSELIVQADLVMC